MTAGWSYNVDHGRESNGYRRNHRGLDPYIHPIDISQPYR